MMYNNTYSRYFIAHGSVNLVNVCARMHALLDNVIYHFKMMLYNASFDSVGLL